MSRLAIALLGSYWTTLDGLPVTAFATDKIRALLAYLAVESERPQRREALASLLWPDHTSAAARTSLRQALYRLRCALGDRDADPPHLLITAKDVQLDPDSDLWVDASEFEAAISVCGANHLGGRNLCPDCVARLETAVALYRGNFLSGFSLRACPRFDWWQLNSREAYERQALQALAWLTDHYEVRGDYDLVSKHAHRKLDLEPWRESAHRRLMRAMALSGERTEALKQYESCRSILTREMGVEPSLQTTQLYEQIRAGAPVVSIQRP